MKIAQQSPDNDPAVLGLGSQRGGDDVVEALGDVVGVVTALSGKVLEIWTDYFALGEEFIDLIPLYAEVAAVETREEPGAQSPNRLGSPQPGPGALEAGQFPAMLGVFQEAVTAVGVAS
ncbi:hypothetical protein ACFWAT_00230 [Streptomyces syringium]|uniref:hypothetical protein n=1 Tax=Streptomyces syringium TaxID=76729 RepID=UPI0036680101